VRRCGVHRAPWGFDKRDRTLWERPSPLKPHQPLRALVKFRSIPYDNCRKINSSRYYYCLYRHFRTFSIRGQPLCTQVRVIAVRGLDHFTNSNLFSLVISVVRRRYISWCGRGQLVAADRMARKFRDFQHIYVPPRTLL
jgi:hypothetical protein